MTNLLDQPSLSVSWADDLPPATPVDLPPGDEDTSDVVEAQNAGPGICKTCGEVIVREPGTRGRLPKYHPDCRPVASVRGTVTRGGTARQGTKEREADAGVAAFKSVFVKTAIGISMVDKYDGFCMMAALPGICQNLKSVLVRYDWLRKEFLLIQSGGSIIGLVFGFLMMMLPMAAHHGLIPKSRFAEFLVNLPVQIFRLSKQLKDGEEKLTQMMEDQLAAATMPAKAATQNGAS